MVEVIRVDVGDERNRGVVVQERAVRFVCLDNEEFALAGRRRLAERLNDATVHKRWVLAKFEQGGDDHAG